MDRLVVSNIAWEAADNAAAIALLQEKGVRNIEVAPTKIRPEWADITEEAVTQYAAEMRALGFSLPSMQALLFKKPELVLFGDEEARRAALAHMNRVVDIAAILGAKSLVFGSPKNRLTNGRPFDECFDIATSFFREAGAYAAEKGVCICLEANPTNYGCDFMTTAVDAARLVRAVNSNGVRLHLDSACMHLAQDDIRALVENNIDILSHVHVSEPELGNFHQPAVNHAIFAQALNDFKYKGYISIEMRSSPDALRNLEEAVNFVSATYGLTPTDRLVAGEGKTSCLIGYSGFVGSNLREQFKFTHFYNSKNISDIRNKSFDIVVCAGCPAVKYLANQNPENDIQVVKSLAENLRGVKAGKFVCISTIDVYPHPDQAADEDTDCHQPNHAYGTHRLWFEDFCRENFPNCLVVRLPALFGKYLKKNYIYDLLNNRCLDMINVNSSFQWYDLSRLGQDLKLLLQPEHANLTLINLFPESLSTRTWVEKCFPELVDKCTGGNGKQGPVYRLATKHSSLFLAGEEPQPFMEPKAATLERLVSFVNSCRNGV
eukprot:GILJ01004115.1.p1 GENE.GILJ01004115.1~~GILJ01004115.1.p1  ORF type:complete len:547 (+),score=74.22 GILJ01004115.1:41-1681(+)